MDKGEILGKLADIIKEVLDDDSLNIDESSVASEIEDWDSINHVEIIASIEEEFDVRFKTLEIEEFKNVGDIVAGVESKLNA